MQFLLPTSFKTEKKFFEEGNDLKKWKNWFQRFEYYEL